MRAARLAKGSGTIARGTKYGRSDTMAGNTSHQAAIFLSELGSDFLYSYSISKEKTRQHQVDRKTSQKALKVASPGMILRAD